VRENLGEGESDPANGVRRRRKKNSPSVLSRIIGKRSRESRNRGSEAGTAHSGRDGKGPVPLRKPK